MTDFHGVKGEDYGLEQPSGGLAEILTRVAALQDEKDRIAAEAKRINKELEAVEQLAVEQLAASGLDGVRAAGKSWYLREFFSVSVPPESREAVVAAAKRACPEMISVNTTSLKSWLLENRSSGEAQGTDSSLCGGTPFDGLLKEFREMRLSHRSIA